MAKKNSTAIPEQNVTNMFTEILKDWDKLIKDETTGLKWIEQPTLNISGHNRPDIVADLGDKIKLVVEVKAGKTKAFYDKAKEQLDNYFKSYEADEFTCIGAVVLYDKATNSVVIRPHLRNGFDLVEVKNTQNLDIIEWFDDILEKVIYQNSDKQEDLKPLIEKEIKTQVKQLHELVRNGGGIKAESKVFILNACVFACGFKDFREKVLQYADDGTFSSKVAAKINFEVMEYKPTVTKSISYCLDEMERNDQVLNKKDVDYKDYITNTKYHIPGVNKMSIVKAICCFITAEIFEKIESTYKNATLDISSILYHEFIKYTRGDGKDNGIVLTADHISRLMARLIITSPKDRVLDVCTGSGSLLLACRDRKKELIKTEEDERYVNDGYMGIERQNHMFFLSFTNLHFNNMNIDYIHVNDCHEVSQQEYDDFGATCGILNPPYSMSKKNNNAETHAEWAFVLRALNNIKKGGRLAVIIPVSCGSEEDDVNIGFKKKIMENNTLEKIIKISPLAFSTATTFTQIFVFTAGVPHEENHKVLVTDYTEDGYNMQSDRGRITGDVEALEERINDICFNNKIIKGLSYFKTFKPEDEWIYLPEDDEMCSIKEIIKFILTENEAN
jgi:hypothetical protein